MFISDAAAQGIKQSSADNWLFYYLVIKSGLNRVKKVLCSIQSFPNAFAAFSVVDAHAFDA